MLDIRLASGRGIAADGVHISRTYARLIEGWPDDELNREILESLPTDLAAQFSLPPPGAGARRRGFVVVPPAFTERKSPLSRGSFTIRFLPKVRVMARFTSTPIREGAGSASALAIAWFQGDPRPQPGDEGVTQMPIVAPEILPQIRAIDWDSHAWDYWD